MQLLSAFSNHNGVRIHYLDTAPYADAQYTPVVICPGLSETAEEYAELALFLLPRRSIMLSFRGRGQSQTPCEGYDLDDHVTDIESVLRETNLSYCHLFSYSRGVSYALKYAQKHPSSIASLIIGDYPAEHRQMTPEWAEAYIEHYLIPQNRLGHIRPEAVRAIQRESTQIALHAQINVPVLVTRGMLEDSLITDEDLQNYREMCTNLSIEQFYQSGHTLKSSEMALFYETVELFLKQN